MEMRWFPFPHPSMWYSTMERRIWTTKRPCISPMPSQKGEASGLRKGEAQGREDALRDLARKKASQGKDVAIIAAELEADVETVERLLKEEC